MHNGSNEIYSVYVSSFAVELRPFQSLGPDTGRHVCSHSNYENIREFAASLAQQKQIPFQNYVNFEF